MLLKLPGLLVKEIVGLVNQADERIGCGFKVVLFNIGPIGRIGPIARIRRWLKKPTIPAKLGHSGIGSILNDQSRSIREY